MQGILAFAASEKNPDQAAMDASLACHLLPIPVTEAPAVAFDALYRGVDSGLIALVSCLRDYFKVPVIPLTHLCDFFSVNQVPYLGHAPVARAACPSRKTSPIFPRRRFW